MFIQIIDSIKKKGLIETIVRVILFVLNIVLSKIKVLWLLSRGYNIDFSVNLGKGSTFSQSTKNSIKIRRNCVIGDYVDIRTGFGGSISIDKGVHVYSNTRIDIHSRLEIGEDSLVAPFCYLTDYNHNFTSNSKPIKDQGYVVKPVVIGKNVWLGTHVVVLKGVQIGDNCVIGAGSIVTRNIPANSVAVGVPARVIRKRNR